eukprot:TRINITY_DN243_c0_g1_i1.p1 TRINITY_DN243_c0_g1~~TRINITY_DN243_c0_g1_i1.p1  ORF type:complete len:448 (+),score=34.91 TRINITY_DN243_c0_g1_i1:4989-6332(+)
MHYRIQDIMNNVKSGSEEYILNAGDTAWILVAAAMVMLMTPALGFFYGGLVRRKNILHLIMQCYIIFAAISIIWALLGYSLMFGESKGHFIGDSHYFALRNVNEQPYPEAPTVPGVVFFFFQLCACAITPALIVGGLAERFGLISSVIFSCVWVIIVYCPVGHWVFHEEGWLKELGAKDFAGGMVVHMTAGFSTLAISIVANKRREPKEHTDAFGAHNVSYTILGAALLWFGWFGYNGGAAFSAGWQTGVSIINTNLAAATGGLGWGIIDYIYKKQVTASGFAIGTVCGLIAMTAGCGFCPMWSSLLIGLLGGIFSHLVVNLREHYHLFDDTLDVFGCHGICGTWGVFAAGLWASADTPGRVDGAFYGNGKLLGYQLAGIAAVAAYSFVLTFVLAFAMKFAGILTVSEADEKEGLDRKTYGEEVYVIQNEIVRTNTVQALFFIDHGY